MFVPQLAPKGSGLMNKLLIFALSVLSAFMAAPALASRDTARYTSLTVFGDSLVDAGNLYVATGGTQPDPALGYYQNRFTNGYDYSDLLSLDLFGAPTMPSLLGGGNFAVGGARVVDTEDAIPDLQAQFGAFQLSGRGIDPNGLYIFNFGANDVFGAKGVFGEDEAIGSYPDISSYLHAAAEQYVLGVKTLNDLGARNILITDFPLAGDPLTIEANGYLGTALSNLTLASGTDLFFYSLSGFNQRVLTNPASFGLPPQRVDTNCIAEGAQSSGCTGIFSFDGVHPTAAIQLAGYHDMDQQFGLSAVTAVPETDTWVMMILGMGMVGAAMRYRPRSRKIAAACTL
jgi:phospholipase/lecithinase/hemolysin